MKVVVTGGSGQLGTVVLRRLAADRSVEKIVALDLRPPLVASRKVSYVRADVRDSDLERHLAGAGAVVHLAFLVTRAAPQSEFLSVNVEGSKNVFHAAAAAKVATVVYASSVAAYGIVPGHPDPIVEETPRREQPDFPYGAAKHAVEAFLDGFEEEHPEMAISRLRPVVLAGRRMEHGPGPALRAGIMLDFGWPAPPLVWDEDVAQAAVLALKQRARGAFNLAAEEPLALEEAAAVAGMRRVPVPRSLVRGAARLALRVGVQPKEDPSWLELEPVPLPISCRRAREELGWKPRYPTGRDVAKALGDAAHRRTDPRIAVFLRLAAVASTRAQQESAEARRISAKIHLELLGRGGGDYTLSLHEGRLSVSPGAPRPPSSVLTLTASTLVDLLAGRTAVPTAELTGKVRVEGEPLGMMLLSGMVTLFREQAGSREPSALPTRLMARWFGDPKALARAARS